MNAQAQAVPAIPFAVSSQLSNRNSFNLTPTALDSGSQMVTPVQIPAVGYVQSLLLDVTIDTEGGTGPYTFNPDAPWNVIKRANLRNAAGVNLLAPLSGYQLYLYNKFGGMTTFGQSADPTLGTGYSLGTAVGSQTRFFISVPIGLDIEEAYGAIPALASNANYQIELELAGIGEVFGASAPDSASVSIDARVIYWDLPAATDSSGRAQETQPPSDGLSIVQIENPTVSPGGQYVKSFNVGNIIRGHILVLRDENGARTEVDLPSLFELYIDNNPRFSMTKRQLDQAMGDWFGYLGATKRAAASAPTTGHTQLDTGVIVLPYHALLGSQAGDPNNSRAQLLPTLDATLLQFHAQDFGSGASKLEIITQAVTTQDPGYLYQK